MDVCVFCWLAFAWKYAFNGGLRDAVRNRMRIIYIYVDGILGGQIGQHNFFYFENDNNHVMLTFPNASKQTPASVRLFNCSNG